MTTNKFSIFTTICNVDDIPFALALGKSLRILNCHKVSDLNCICSQEVDIKSSLTQLSEIWTISVNASINHQYLNVLAGYSYINYTTIMYIDSHTIFFNSPVSLFNISTPASLFNSIYSSYMSRMYLDVLYPKHEQRIDVFNPNYTIGHLHVYGRLANNYPISYDIMRQAILGKYANILNQQTGEIDSESLVRAIDSRFMIFQPDINFYIFAKELRSLDLLRPNPYMIGTIIDTQIMSMILEYYDKCLLTGSKLPMWKNLVHNYRVPKQLIRTLPPSRKKSIIYRKDTIDGLLISQISIYGIESDINLVKIVNTLSHFDNTTLSKLAPVLEPITTI